MTGTRQRETVSDPLKSVEKCGALPFSRQRPKFLHLCYLSGSSLGNIIPGNRSIFFGIRE